MPNEKICVRHYDRVFCWNKETGKIEEITYKEINATDCPDTVVLQLMRLIGEKKF